jgi:hypothetical protein
MPDTRMRFPPSGPFYQPDGDVSNGLPIAKLRCEAAADIELTDVSGPQTLEFTPNNGSIVVPEDSAVGEIGYVMDVKAHFLNRKGLTSTNARVDMSVEVWNDTTSAWVAAGSVSDLYFSIPKNQNAVTLGDPSASVTAGTYTKARLTLAANAGGTATGPLAGVFAADDPRIEIELYRGIV